MSDTQRTATEQLLITNAIDRAVSQVDFRPLKGKLVFFDTLYLDGVVDKGYLISSIRQHLLASGCILQEDRAKATYVVEARAGAVGTDRYSVLIGVPQMTVPSIVPGQPSQIPEIPFAKKNDEQGVAKIAIFAYNRQTGHRLWQSGIVESISSARNTWFMGLGPFRAGSILHGTEFAGGEIPNPLNSSRDDKEELVAHDVAPVTWTAIWPEETSQKADIGGLVGWFGRVMFGAQFPNPSRHGSTPPELLPVRADSPKKTGQQGTESRRAPAAVDARKNSVHQSGSKPPASAAGSKEAKPPALLPPELTTPEQR